MKRFAQLVLRFYKRLVSPMLPPACRYVPTCSEYAMEAIERHGVMLGGVKALWRLLRCNPLAKGGYDPVVKINSRPPATSCQLDDDHGRCNQYLSH